MVGQPFYAKNGLRIPKRASAPTQIGSDGIVWPRDDSPENLIYTDENGDPWLFAGKGKGIHNVLDYGAVADGVTDSTASFQSAVDDCAAKGGGVVLIPPGNFAWSGLVKINDPKVSLRGGGVYATTLIPTGASSRIQFGSNVSEFSGGAVHIESGYHGEFSIDDQTSQIATNPLYVGTVVGARFRDIRINFSGGNNIEVHLAQNCVFDNVWSQFAGSNNLVLDHGTGGNLFYKCNLNRAGVLSSGRQLHILQSSPVSFAYSEPTDNYFLKCIFERSGGNMDAAVRINAAQLIQFVSCVFTGTDAGAGIPVIDIDKIGIEPTSFITFGEGCFFISGAVGTQTGILFREGDVYVANGVEFRNFNVALSLGDTADIFQIGLINYNNCTSRFSNAFGGVTTEGSRIRTQAVRFDQFVPAASELALFLRVRGESQSRLRILGSGEIQWGDGTNSMDVQLRRNGPDGLLLADGDFLSIHGYYNRPLAFRRNGPGAAYAWVDDAQGIIRVKSSGGWPSSDTDGIAAGAKLPKTTVVGAGGAPDATADGTVSVYLLDGSAATCTLNLPAAPTDGQTFRIKSIDSTNTVTVNGNGNNIDGAASTMLVTNESIEIIYDPTFGWAII